MKKNEEIKQGNFEDFFDVYPKMGRCKLVDDKQEELQKATEWDYGTFPIYVTTKDVEELINGKIMVIPVNDEYNVCIKYKKD